MSENVFNYCTEKLLFGADFSSYVYMLDIFISGDEFGKELFNLIDKVSADWNPNKNTSNSERFKIVRKEVKWRDKEKSLKWE